MVRRMAAKFYGLVVVLGVVQERAIKCLSLVWMPLKFVSRKNRLENQLRITGG